MHYLDTLNEQQKRAVLHTGGPLLVLAGAGAGKTRVIAHRILHLIHEGVAPERILAITFTNKAAKEMRERITAPLKTDTRPFVATFHALGVHILRNNARHAGIPRRFAIFDRNDSLSAIKQAVKTRGYDPKAFEPRKILSAISKQKGNGVPLSAYEERAGDEFHASVVADMWRAYDAELRKSKALDFDDLLTRTLELLKRNDAVREHYQSAWSHIHIDEYQDTNTVQYTIANILADTHKNICVVGDIDQNIYTWRGARAKNVFDFEAHYPDAATVVLEQNYRSTKTILGASNDVIRKNKDRKEKNLFTDNAVGENITLIPALDETHEACIVAEKAADLIQKGATPREIAALYRANFQSRALEEAFLSRSVPYQVLGTRFFERKEVKDVLAFIAVALEPENVAALARIVNVPPRGIGKTTLMRMIEKKERELSPAMKQRVDDFHELLSNIKAHTLSKPPSATLQYVLRASGLRETLSRGSEDDIERLENIKELVALARRYDSLPPEEGIEKLFEDAALATDQDELKENKNAVRLMTVHASKGLEFDTVFVTGLEDGLFPHASDDPHKDHEEERRLFYVALTRARKKVYLTYASTRTMYGSRGVSLPSEFISDIPEHFLEYEEPAASPIKTIYLE